MHSAFNIPHSAFFLVGPTAVGKSEVAVELAEHFDAEIVNADAFQLYAGLDLLSAKPDDDALAQVRHHLVGTFARTETMSVARYLAAARSAVADINSRGRRAFVVGGTGLYVRALTHGLTPGPASNPELRSALAELSLPAALERLRASDPVAHDRIDRQNPRRVLRALEVAILRDSQPPDEPAAPILPGIVPQPFAPFLGVFLRRERIDLQQRIASRTDEMFRRGVLAEVAAVDPGSLGPTAVQMIGWRECLACTRGELSETEARERITLATRQYSKRQVTWFRRETCFLDHQLGPASSTEDLIDQFTTLASANG